MRKSLRRGSWAGKGLRDHPIFAREMSAHDRTESVLRCVCGHEGKITSYQSDKGWGVPHTNYTITGLGKPLSTNIEKWSSFGDAIAVLKPECPECGETLTSAALR